MDLRSRLHGRAVPWWKADKPIVRSGKNLDGTGWLRINANSTGLELRHATMLEF